MLRISATEIWTTATLSECCLKTAFFPRNRRTPWCRSQSLPTSTLRFTIHYSTSWSIFISISRYFAGLFRSEGTAVAQWLRCCATNRKVAGSIPAGVSGFFIDMKSFRSHYGPGVDSTSNRNEYQDKGGRCIRLTTLPPSCAVVTKSGNLNFLDPTGLVDACNGTALPLPLPS